MVSIRAQLIEELGFDPDEPSLDRAAMRTARGSGVVATYLVVERMGEGSGPFSRGEPAMRGPGALAGALSQALELLRGQETVAQVAARLAPAQIAAAEHDGESVAVVRTQSGRLYMLPDRCPHDGGRISDGVVEGEQVVCARHGWEIDACSGRCERRGGVSAGPSIPLIVPSNLGLGASSSTSNAGVILAAPQLVQLVPPRLRKVASTPAPAISGRAPRSDS